MLETKRRTAYSPGMIVERTIIEQIGSMEHGYSYAVRRGDGSTAVEATYTVGGTTYYPMEQCPWPCPTGFEEYGTPEKLHSELRDFTVEHVDIPSDERYYDAITCWLMADWVQDWFNVATYLHFHGPSGSGKSRALEILQTLGYRVLISPSISAPALYRTIETFRSTFLVDEAELYSGEGLEEGRREVLSILNAGYRRGQFAIRSDQKGETIRLFNVWGFKALASIQSLPETLQNRCIRVPMMRATRPVRRRIDEEWAETIRNKLLMYRFDHLLKKPEPGLNPIDVPDGRIVEIFTPLVLVAPDGKVEQRLINLARDIYMAMVEEEQTTQEAQVFISLLSAMRPGEPTVPLSDIADKYNEGKPKTEQISNQSVGYILKRLGFRKRRDSKTGRVAAVIDDRLITRLKVRYSIAEQTKLPSEEPKMGIIAEALERLTRLTETVTEFDEKWLSQTMNWDEKFTKRILEIAEGDGLIFRTPSGRWKRSP